MRRVEACIVLMVLALSACATPPTATPMPPTATPMPATATPMPPTATPMPATVAPTRAMMGMTTPTLSAMIVQSASQPMSSTVGQKVPVILGYYTEVGPDRLKSMLEKKDFVFINVHIPYAGEIANTDAFIAYDQISRSLDKLPQDKNAKIVLYCSSGHMGTIASETLVRLGYTNVFNLAGGMKAWGEQKYPLLNNPK